MTLDLGNSTLRVSIVLPAINETVALRKTVQRIETTNCGDVLEYLIVLCRRTTRDCRAVAEVLVAELPPRVRIIEQQLPFVGGAVRDAFAAARGTHVIMMASDLETDPAAVPVMVAEARRRPAAIISASRWKSGIGFEGYNPVKLVLNKIFQKSFAMLYRVRLTDITYAYRLFPTELVQSIQWEELKHPFFLETIVKPLRLGVEVVEIPTVWRARTEGESQNTFLRNFVYFRIGLKTLFMSRQKILRRPA
jgi:glycosyltransferase involved in cell wall biosynthesis